MMALRSVACVGLLLAAAAVCAGSGASPQSVLVLLDSLDQEASFGRFLQGLRDTGYSLDVRRISDPSLQLKDWDEWRYTKIAILASGSQRERRPAKLPASQQNGRQEPTCARLAASSLAAPASAADCLTPPVGIAELGGTADAAQLASFVDEGGDLLLALSPAAPDELRALAQTLGVDADPAGTSVIDHFSFSQELGGDNHAAIWTAAPVALPAVFGAGAQVRPRVHA
jgi:hypothetical protein